MLYYRPLHANNSIVDSPNQRSPNISCNLWNNDETPLNPFSSIFGSDSKFNKHRRIRLHRTIWLLSMAFNTSGDSRSRRVLTVEYKTNSKRKCRPSDVCCCAAAVIFSTFSVTPNVDVVSDSDKWKYCQCVETRKENVRIFYSLFRIDEKWNSLWRKLSECSLRDLNSSQFPGSILFRWKLCASNGQSNSCRLYSFRLRRCDVITCPSQLLLFEIRLNFFWMISYFFLRIFVGDQL